MKREGRFGRSWMQGLPVATLFAATVASAAPPPVVESGTGAVNARTVGRVTISGVGQNINIRSFRWGVASPPSTSGGGLPKPLFAEFYVTKAVDSSSPTLMSRTATGTNIPSVVIEVFTPGTTTVLAKYELSDARLSAVTDGDQGTSTTSGGQPLEEVGFYYRRLKTTVGGVVHCFDQQTGTSC